MLTRLLNGFQPLWERERLSSWVFVALKSVFRIRWKIPVSRMCCQPVKNGNSDDEENFFSFSLGAFRWRSSHIHTHSTGWRMNEWRSFRISAQYIAYTEWVSRLSVFKWGKINAPRFAFRNSVHKRRDFPPFFLFRGEKSFVHEIYHRKTRILLRVYNVLISAYLWDLKF